MIMKHKKSSAKQATSDCSHYDCTGNEYDAWVIAFVCHIDDKWQRIGYVVRECVEHVHLALSEKRTLSIKLSWARSGPRFYAEVIVTLGAEWHRDIVHSQSTR